MRWNCEMLLLIELLITLFLIFIKVLSDFFQNFFLAAAGVLVFSGSAYKYYLNLVCIWCFGLSYFILCFHQTGFDRFFSRKCLRLLVKYIGLA